MAEDRIGAGASFGFETLALITQIDQNAAGGLGCRGPATPGGCARLLDAVWISAPPDVTLPAACARSLADPHFFLCAW